MYPVDGRTKQTIHLFPTNALTSLLKINQHGSADTQLPVGWHKTAVANYDAYDAKRIY